MENKYREFLLYVLIFLASFGIIYCVLGTSYIPSASMEPTLSVGHKYTYFKLGYIFSGPDRGDIVIYDKNGVVYCKRVIGLPGDHIELRDGKVFMPKGNDVINSGDEVFAFGTKEDVERLAKFLTK